MSKHYYVESTEKIIFGFWVKADSQEEAEEIVTAYDSDDYMDHAMEWEDVSVECIGDGLDKKPSWVEEAHVLTREDIEGF
jgi:hypothetical protein